MLEIDITPDSALASVEETLGDGARLARDAAKVALEAAAIEAVVFTYDAAFGPPLDHTRGRIGRGILSALRKSADAAGLVKREMGIGLMAVAPEVSELPRRTPGLGLVAVAGIANSLFPSVRRHARQLTDVPERDGVRQLRALISAQRPASHSAA